MKKINKGKLVLFYSGFLVLCSSNVTLADRQTSVTAGLFLRQGFDSNIHRTPTNETEEWTTAVGPSISIDSSSRRDSLLLRYAPSYVFNHRTDDGEIEHHLNLSADRAVSDKYKLSLTDSFNKSDDSTLSKETAATTTEDIQLTENRQRTRYWSNFFAIGSAWEYKQNSSLGMRYAHTIFDTEGLESDYQRHSPSLSISHEINHQWLADFAYKFIKGDFDQSEDSDQHSGNARLSYRLTPHSSLYGEGHYLSTNYDETKVDYATYGGRIGFSNQLGQHTLLDMAAGYAANDRDNSTNTDALDYAISLSREFKRGTFSVSGTGGFDDKQFNGARDGLSKFWSLSARISYNLAQNLSLSMHGLFQNDQFLEQNPERDEDTIDAGCSLNWTFLQWYTANIRYLYHRLDADIATDDYEDHRLYLTFSIAKELWRW